MKLIVTEDIGAVAGALVAEGLEQAKAERGLARLAVPGGGSPVPVFSWLAAHYDSADTVLTWVDERHLPLPELGFGDWRALPEASNLRATWQHWLRWTTRRPRLLPLARAGELDEVCAEVARDIAALGGLDVVLLGAGADGHIASLFPGHPALSSTALCVAVRDSPKPPPERLSLTLPVLAAARRVVFVASGAGKAAMLARARRGELPLGRLRPQGEHFWILDPAAATQLEGT